MAHIAIVSQRLLGHVLPILGVAVELARRGHQVTLLGHVMNETLVRGAGISFTAIGWDKIPNRYMEHMMRDLLRVIDPKTDLIIGDSSQCAPAYTAELLGLPWVSFQTTVPLPDELLPGGAAVNERLRANYEAELNGVRDCFGLPPLQDKLRTRGDYAGLSPDLHLLLALPELAGDGWRFPASARFVGGSSHAWHRAGAVEGRIHIPGGAPQLVVCTSSVPRIEYREVMNRYVRAAIGAFAEGGQDVWICENVPRPAHPPLPDHIRWLNEHPVHHLLLPAADAAITHGGCGTLQQCIRSGTPMVIVPLGADHAILAERCRELGVAVVLDPEAIDEKALRDRVTEVRQPDYQRRAAALAQRVQAYTPNETAADLIGQVLGNGRP